jgi:hypothetical protein
MLKAGFGVALGVVVNGNVLIPDAADVPGVPDKAVSLSGAAVPVPNVAVNVSNIGFWVSVGVSACVGVSVIVGGAITGVVLGSTVEVGSACSVCCERTAAVASRFSVGRGAVACGRKLAGKHALRVTLSTVTRKNSFFIANSLT